MREPKNNLKVAGKWNAVEESTDEAKQQRWDVRRWMIAIKRRTKKERDKEREDWGDGRNSFWKYSKESDWHKLLNDTAKDLQIDLAGENYIPPEFKNQLAVELSKIGFRFEFSVIQTDYELLT